MQKLSSAAFVQVLVTCLSDGMMEELKQLMTKIDPSLRSWKRYLTSACRYLIQRNLFAILLDMQVFMRDFVRAGKSCIKLFKRSQSYEDQKTALESAKDYFLKALSEAQNEMDMDQDSGMDTDGSTLGEKDDDDVDDAVRGPAALAAVAGELKTINLQLEVLSFTHRLPAKERADPPLTLFGADEERRALTELAVFHGNFDLAFRLLQECQLPVLAVATAVLERNAKARDASAMQALVRSIQVLLADEERDELIQKLVDLLVSEMSDLKTAEMWVPKLQSPSSRVKAYIACMKLKQAYMEAVKISDVELVKLVREAAIQWGMNREIELCEQYLLQNYQQQ